MKTINIILIAFLAFAGTIKAQIYTGVNMGVNYNNGMVVDLAPLSVINIKFFRPVLRLSFFMPKKQIVMHLADVYFLK